MPGGSLDCSAVRTCDRAAAPSPTCVHPHHPRHSLGQPGPAPGKGHRCALRWHSEALPLLCPFPSPPAPAAASQLVRTPLQHEVLLTGCPAAPAQSTPLYSMDGAAFLVLQGDGNLVL